MQKPLLNNQSLLDFTLHHCGTLQSIIDVAIENKINITDTIAPGTVLTLPSEIVKDNEIVSFYYDKKIIPACGYVEEPEIDEYGFPEGEFPISL